MTPLQSFQKELIIKAKELLAATTPGPWKSEARFGFVPQWQVVKADNLICGSSTKKEDAEFIAFARNHMADLIARVEQQERDSK